MGNKIVKDLRKGMSKSIEFSMKTEEERAEIAANVSMVKAGVGMFVNAAEEGFTKITKSNLEIVQGCEAKANAAQRNGYAEFYDSIASSVVNRQHYFGEIIGGVKVPDIQVSNPIVNAMRSTIVDAVIVEDKPKG